MPSVSGGFLFPLVMADGLLLVRRLDRAREKLERQLEEVAVEIDQDEEAADATAAAADAAA